MITTPKHYTMKNSVVGKCQIYHSLLWVFVLMVIFSCPFQSCSRNKPVTEGKVEDRQKTPSLVAREISTVISDSGITRYRITTPEMLIFDKEERSNWLFPKGLHFERFDENYKADAQIDCKWAIYYDIEKLWILKDSVRCTNISGETFSTDILNWDEKQQKIYSDAPISITKKTMVINGIGFESNQMLTKYRINKVTGVLPIDAEEESDTLMNK